jgi:hypothetical protein
MEHQIFAKPLTSQDNINKTKQNKIWTNIPVPCWIQTHYTSGKKLQILDYLITKISHACCLSRLAFAISAT